MRPKSEIYTPKRDDEHPHPFHMRSPPRAAQVTLKPPFQSEAKCEAIDMKITFLFSCKMKLIITRKRFPLSFVLKVRVLELGNGLFIVFG